MSKSLRRRIINQLSILTNRNVDELGKFYSSTQIGKLKLILEEKKMTEEQIKQNAEIRVFTENSFRKEYKKLILTSSEEKIAKDFYVAGAHSRDEEIKELKEEIESLQEQYNTCFDGFTKRGTKLGELMRENVQLRNPWRDARKELPPAKEIPDIPDYSSSTDCVVKVGDSNFYQIAVYDHYFKCWCDANDYETIVRNVTKWMSIPEIPKG